MGRIGGILKEWRRRFMFRAAALYIFGAWVILQVADLIFGTWGIPDHALRYVWLGALLFAPVALVFAWRYNLTLQGIVRTQPSHPGQTVDLSLRRMDYTIIMALVMVVGVVAYGLVKEILETGRGKSIFRSGDVLQNSIAVLPFENVGGDKATEPFAIGIHDDLLTQVSKIGLIKTISRNSVMQYRGTTKTTPQIAAELGVANILEGAVQWAGNRVRIYVQLIDAATDGQLWAETYDRQLTATNIFVIQTDIAVEIAQSLQITLSPDVQNRLDTVPTESLAALEEYFLGRQQMEQRTICALAEAVTKFEKSIDLDPDFVLPRTGLVLAFNLQTAYSDLSGPAAVAKMQPHVEKALALNPGLAEVRVSKGAWHENRGELEDAEKEYELAIELNRNYALAYMWLGNVLINQDRLHEAAVIFNKAVDLNPRYAPLKIQLARVEAYRGQLAAARALAESARSLELYNPLAAQQESEWLRSYGCLQESFDEARNAYELDREGIQVLVRFAYAHMDQGDFAEAGTLIEGLWTKNLTGSVNNLPANGEGHQCLSVEQDEELPISARINWQVMWLKFEYHFLRREYGQLDQYASTMLPEDPSDYSRDARVAYMWSGLAKLILGDHDSAAQYFDAAYSNEMKYRFDPNLELRFRGLQTLAQLLQGQYDKADESFLQGLDDVETAYRHGWRIPDFLERTTAICALQNDSTADPGQSLPNSWLRMRDMCPLELAVDSSTNHDAKFMTFLRYLGNQRINESARDIDQIRQIVVAWMQNPDARDARCDDL